VTALLVLLLTPLPKNTPKRGQTPRRGDQPKKEAKKKPLGCFGGGRGDIFCKLFGGCFWLLAPLQGAACRGTQ
jgi:hypothetical protein